MNMTIEQLQEKLKSIRERCSGWQKCNDGSYERALDAQGFYKYYDELSRKIDEREKNNGR